MTVAEDWTLPVPVACRHTDVGEFMLIRDAFIVICGSSGHGLTAYGCDLVMEAQTGQSTQSHLVPIDHPVVCFSLPSSKGLMFETETRHSGARSRCSDLS